MTTVPFVAPRRDGIDLTDNDLDDETVALMIEHFVLRGFEVTARYEGEIIRVVPNAWIAEQS